MSDFYRKLDNAMEDARNRQEKAAAQAQQAARIDSQRLRSAERAASEAWNPVLVKMGHRAVDAANYLSRSGIRSDQIHRITRQRDSGFFVSAKAFTVPVSAWIIGKETTNHSDGEGYQSSSWTETRGAALGVDGSVYKISDCPSYLTRGKLCTQGPVAELLGSDHDRVVNSLQCFNRNLPFPHEELQAPNNSEVDEVISSWEEGLTRFVVRIANRS